MRNKGFVLWFTGLPCSGKTTIADNLAKKLQNKGYKIERLDGDIVRKEGLSNDLGFSKEDRDKNIQRVTFVAKLLSRNGIGVLATFVSPYEIMRKKIQQSVMNCIIIYVKASKHICIQRDVKGMWAKAKAGKIKNFTGYDDPYEPPLSPHVVCYTDVETINESVQKIYDYLFYNRRAK